ncbi:MAG: trypsin-like serine protease [Myxococcales bacterium]|nr:trypsin-like serine protease [Myxococcales bacterium]
MRAHPKRGVVACALIVVGVAGASACGGADPSTEQSRSAIVGGKPVARSADPAVVCLYKPSQASCASGTLVAPRVVLAAAHSTVAFDVTELRVIFGSHVVSGRGDVGFERQVIAKHEAPDADLVLLLLDDNGPTLPLQLTLAELEHTDLGRAARVVGFGATANDREDQDRKRSGVTHLDALSEGPVFAASSSWPRKGYVVYYGRDGAKSCFGDSGAPLLAREGDGVERVIGVSSFGTEADCTRGASGAVRIDRARAWLEQTLGALDPRRSELSLCGEGGGDSAADSDCCARDGHCNTRCERDVDCGELSLLPAANNGADADETASGCAVAARGRDGLLGGVVLLLVWVWLRRRWA